MITTRISREKLYRREYEKDTVINIMNGGFGGEALSGLAKVISLMIKEEIGG